MAAFPYILYGIVYDTDSTTALASIKITARNERTNEAISNDTNSSGEYSLDAANFTSGYSDDDIVTLYVIYTNKEGYEEHTIVAGQGGANIDLTLVEVPASDQLRYFTVQDFFDFHHFTIGGENVPLTNEVVAVGVGVEEEIDNMCSTRFSDGAIEISVNDCDATTGWTTSTDAVAIAVTTTIADYRTRTGALDLGKSGATQAYFYYRNSALGAKDFRNRYVACWVYMASLSTLAATGEAVTLRYGSDTSNYYSKPFYKGDLVAGWNLLYFKLDDDEVVKTSNPVDSACTYFEVYFTNTAATDTVTAGTFILDNVFLIHEDHFIQEYFDTKNNRQWDYYLTKQPVDRLIQFWINRAQENQAPSWDELRSSDNEIKLDKQTGRVRLVDTTTSLEEGRRVFPLPGVRQVRATYIFGARKVPKDIRKLAILMTTRDFMHSAVSKALMRGQDSFTSEHFTVLDNQINRILSRYRAWDMFNV